MLRRHVKQGLFLNEHGMSLISVMVASAIGLVLVASLTQFMTSLFKATNTVKVEGDINSIITLVNLTLEDSARCNVNVPNIGNGSVTLLPTTPSNTIIPVSKIEYPVGTSILEKAASCNGVAGICIKDLYISDISSSSPNRFMASLTAKISKTGTIGAQEVTRKMSISLGTSAGNIVNSCASTTLTPAQLEKACQTLGGAFDPNTQVCTQGEQTCTQLGGTWTNGACVMGGSGGNCAASAFNIPTNYNYSYTGQNCSFTASVACPNQARMTGLTGLLANYPVTCGGGSEPYCNPAGSLGGVSFTMLDVSSASLSYSDPFCNLAVNNFSGLYTCCQ